MLTNRFFVVVSVCFASTGCSTSHFDDVDAEAGIDSSTPDTMEVVVAPIGAACDHDSACLSGRCLRTPSTPGGSCSAPCTLGADCPSGSVCIEGGVCQPECTTSSDCRDGYFCSSSACQPGCENDEDCGVSRFCERLSPVGMRGVCRSRDAALGIACEFDAQCSAGGFCFSEDGFGHPQGECVIFAIDGCPGGGVVHATDVIELCVSECATEGDCRSGYRCAAASSGTGCFPGCETDEDCGIPGNVCFPSSGTCEPPITWAGFGEACSNHALDRRCSEFCIDAEIHGWSEGTCTVQDCDADGLRGSPCPASGVCIEGVYTDPARTTCVARCESGGADCRAGYECRDFEGAGGCVPAGWAPGAG